MHGNGEATANTGGVGRFSVAEFDGVVFLQLIPGDPAQFHRPNTIPRKESVERLRSGVARPFGIAQQDASSAAAQNQSRTQASRSAANDDYIVVGHIILRSMGEG